MKLSKTQFEIICILVTLSPFVYLGLAWEGSTEAAKNNHSGLYIILSIVIGSYVVPTILNYFDQQNPSTDTMATNGKVLKLLLVLFGATAGFVGVYGKMLDANKLDSMYVTNILLCIFMIIMGNYQSRIRPNSVYNGLLMRDYSDKVQSKANRYQGRMMVLSGIVLVIAFSLLTRVGFLDGIVAVPFVSIMATVIPQYYAIYTTPPAERKRI
jgi:hypothetical protein